jgi:hypothetical protein
VTGEKRQSPRIVRIVPLALSDGDQSYEVQSGVINAHGALVLSPRHLPPGTAVTLTNRRTGAAIEATVVWNGAEEPGSAFKLGVEFEHASAEFWGDDYRP